MDRAVVSRAEAVDHRRVGLQPHAFAQAVDEHAGDLRPLALERRLLLDHGGEGQRLVRRVVRQPWAALRPGVGEHALHAVVGEREDRNVRGVGGKSIGIGEELALGTHPGVPEGAHDGDRALAAQRMQHVRMLIERFEEIVERRAFDDGELLENHLALLEERDDLLGARMRRNLVVTGLHARPEPPQA